jgi:hypothetical protein
MILAAAICMVLVVAVGLRALPRPAAEMVVDMLYRRAMRASAQAVAADRALCAYRQEMAALRAHHTPEYVEVVP